MNNILVKQIGIKDCGVACMLSIIRYYGGNISMEQLRSLTNTNALGTTLFNMSETFTKLGFMAKGFKLMVDDLDDKKIIYPLIAHVITKKKYYTLLLYTKLLKIWFILWIQL